MAVKECGSHHNSHCLRRRHIIYIICLLIFFVVAIIGGVLTWIIRHPPKPRFTLQDATVFSFNVSGNPPYLLNSSIQITLISSNPNHKTGIYYDSLDVYVSYQSQQITLPTSIPLTYQRHDEFNVWSPSVGPIAPPNALSLVQEQTRGAVNVLVQINGKYRWIVGHLTGTSHLYVRCPASINLGNSSAGVVVGGKGVKYTLVTICSVSV